MFYHTKNNSRTLRSNSLLKVLFLLILTALSVVSCQWFTPDLATSLKHDSGYIQVAKGKLFYEKFGSGSPIVVVHGGPGFDHQYLLPQMLELAKDHEVIFYDQRGSGQSLETPVNTQYINIDRFTDDLDALRKQLDLKEFTLIGHSWGGYLAMNYAVTHPEYLSSLILLHTAPADYHGQLAFTHTLSKKAKALPEGTNDIFQSGKVKTLDPIILEKDYRTFFSIYFYDPKDVKQLHINITNEFAENTVRINEEMSKTSWLRPQNNLFPKLRKLNVPTLIVHGNQDLIPMWTAKDIKDSIPHSEIIYLDHCGHFSPIEKPDELFPQLRAFLNLTQKNSE